MNNNKKFLTLIDGSGYIFRAYYAVRAEMTDDKGNAVNAVFGFCSMLLKILEERLKHNDTPIEDEKIIIVFDAGRATFRNEIDPNYKANRGDTPDDLKHQFAPIKQCVSAFGIPTIEMVGFEADDIIATYTKQARENGTFVRVISSDKDLMQLVEDDKVCIYDSMKDKLICEAEVIEKFGVGPDQLLDVMALIGDAADNVPGVKGIGPKGAAELIKKYGTLEELLKNAYNIRKDKTRIALEEQADAARKSYKLITLDYDVPGLDELNKVPSLKINADGINKFLKTFNFKGLQNRANKLIREWDENYGSEAFNNSDFQIDEIKSNLDGIAKELQEFVTEEKEKVTEIEEIEKPAEEIKDTDENQNPEPAKIESKKIDKEVIKEYLEEAVEIVKESEPKKIEPVAKPKQDSLF